MTDNKKENKVDDPVLTQISEKSDKELREILDELYKEEEKLSYQRRVLHGKIDIIRAELINRLKDKHHKGKEIITSDDLKRLTEILARGTSSDNSFLD